MRWQEGDFVESRAGPLSGEEEADLEALLRAMPLAQPSPRAVGRIEAMLAQRRHLARALPWWASIAAAVIVTAGISIVLIHRNVGKLPRAGPGDPPGLPRVTVAKLNHPLRIERDAARVADEGVIGFAGAIPLRGYHVRSTRQVWYVDPATDRKLCVTIPSNRFVVVPIQSF